MAEQIDSGALHPFYQGIYELVGAEAMLAIFETYRGMQLTIPTHLYDRKKAAEAVRRLANGHNTQELARRYGYSQRWVVKMTREDQ